ncbi:MAG: aspartate-semialdehyde dehydrogenase [Bacilli bacterium]|nr:aspartate-semialdehyde dehydrogenase [Bacilli bacterium]
MMANIALVGATGLVGRTVTKILEERNFPINNLYLFASSKSKGKVIEFKGHENEVEELTEASLLEKELDIAFFTAGAEVSKKYVPLLREKGVVVIDNSSAFRMDEDVPLVVPEVNPEDIFRHKGIIANPNCSTIQSVVPLKVLSDHYGLKRVVYATYQAVSGSGMLGISDLEHNTSIKYPHPITNNILPHIDVFFADGYTKEEWKMIEETKKILHDPKLKVTATTVRVPIKNCHSVAINVELKHDYSLDEVRELFRNSKGIILMDDVKENIYPMPIVADGKDEVFVGRIRRDDTVPFGLNLFVVADNIRKGAATNAVQIAEILIKGCV